MSIFDQGFDATGVDTASNFDVIPAGEYEVIITASEEKFTKNGQGKYLELREEIQSGEYAGRLLFDRLNLKNSNAKAVEIAQRVLAQICHATGVMQVKNAEQLHNIPIIAIVKVRPADGNYDASNEIKGYKAFASAVKQHAPAAPRTSAPAKSTAPWAKV